VSAPEPRELVAGEVLSGRFRVLEKLGEGGFGTVYSALNIALGVVVAIKVAHREDTDALVFREAQVAARLKSPHSVRVFDVGRLESGALYIVMEHLQGRSLRSYLREEGALSAAKALSFVDQICVALHEAHGMNLVHRDIKPSNLFVVEGDHLEPHVKLVDFGLAKSIVAVPSEDLTESGVLVGSPMYMSPEQVRAAPASPASDLWAVGVVLYNMLSQRLPFERPSSSAVLAAIAADPPTPLREFVPDAPKVVLDLIAKCLRKSPHERFASSDELRRALSQARAQLAGDTAKEPEPPLALDSLSTLRSLSLQPPTVRARRVKWVLPVCIGAGVVSVLAFGWRRSLQSREVKMVAPSALPVASHPAHVLLSETPRTETPPAVVSSDPPPTVAPAPRPKPGKRERGAAPPTPTGTPAPPPSGAPSRLVAEPNF